MSSGPMEAELGDFISLANDACKSLWKRGEVIQLMNLNQFIDILKAEMRDIAIKRGSWTKGELSIRRDTTTLVRLDSILT